MWVACHCSCYPAMGSTDSSAIAEVESPSGGGLRVPIHSRTGGFARDDLWSSVSTADLPWRTWRGFLPRSRGVDIHAGTWKQTPRQIGARPRSTARTSHSTEFPRPKTIDLGGRRMCTPAARAAISWPERPKPGRTTGLRRDCCSGRRGRGGRPGTGCKHCCAPRRHVGPSVVHRGGPGHRDAQAGELGPERRAADAQSACGL